MERAINERWTAPPVNLSGTALTVVIKFRLSRNGTVSGVSIERQSGNGWYDDAGRRAVLSAEHLPTFPTHMTEPYLDIKFTFAVGGIDAAGGGKVYQEEPQAPDCDDTPVLQVESLPAPRRNEAPALSVADPPLVGSLTDITKEIAGYDIQIQQYQASVSSKTATLFALDKDLAQAENKHKEAEHRLGPLREHLQKMRAEADATKKTLQTAIDNPRLLDAVRLDVLLKESQVAAGNLEHAEKEAAATQKETESIKLRAEELRRQRRLTELEIAVVNRTILNLLMKRPVIVEGFGECLMHEDITPKGCKEMALTKAKQDAIERGGVSLVQSFSQVSMNDLVKDEIKIETKAHIRKMEMVQVPSHMEEGPLGKYVARIRAVVQSQPLTSFPPMVQQSLHP